MKFQFNSLFSGLTRAAEPASSQAVATSISGTPAAGSLYANSTGEEYNEFLNLMQEGKRPFRKPGLPIQAEYEAWLVHHRARTGPKAAHQSAQA